MNFLSPDSVCYSFDHRANGYGRGEGFVVMLLKRLSDAIRDGDMIRAVIRGTGQNQDGHTPSLSQPNGLAQESLIKRVYEDCNLDFGLTHYVEAHGKPCLLIDFSRFLSSTNGIDRQVLALKSVTRRNLQLLEKCFEPAIRRKSHFMCKMILNP